MGITFVPRSAEFGERHERRWSFGDWVAAMACGGTAMSNRRVRWSGSVGGHDVGSVHSAAPDRVRAENGNGAEAAACAALIVAGAGA